MGGTRMKTEAEKREWADRHKNTTTKTYTSEQKAEMTKKHLADVEKATGRQLPAHFKKDHINFVSQP